MTTDEGRASDEQWAAGTPNWVEIMVGDLERSQAFYRSVLGWEFEDLGPDFGHYNNALSGGRRVAGISPPAPGEDEWPHQWTAYLASTDIEATGRAALENGAHELMEPMEIGGLMRMGLWVDPGGVPFGAWEALAHSGFEARHEPGAVGWVDLTCLDLEAAKSFYNSVFRLEFDDLETEGIDYTMFTPAGTEVPAGGMGIVVDGDLLGPRWAVTFEVDDVVAARQRVIDAGGSAPDEPFEFDSGTIVTVQGPDGEAFSLLAPTPPAGEPERPADDASFTWL